MAGLWFEEFEVGQRFVEVGVREPEPAVEQPGGHGPPPRERQCRVGAQGDGAQIGCRITVNGIVKDERTTDNVNGYISCLDKSA